jgi:hypothetical protein
MVLGRAGLAATVAYRQLMSQQQASRDLLISNKCAQRFENRLILLRGGVHHTL